MMKIFRWNLIILVELHSIKSYLSSQLYPNLKKKKSDLRQHWRFLCDQLEAYVLSILMRCLLFGYHLEFFTVFCIFHLKISPWDQKDECLWCLSRWNDWVTHWIRDLSSRAFLMSCAGDAYASSSLINPLILGVLSFLWLKEVIQ